MTMEMFEHGQTVRLTGMATKGQRQTLWIATFPKVWDYRDTGSEKITIHRQDDPDCIIEMPRRYVTAATVLDLLVAD